MRGTSLLLLPPSLLLPLLLAAGGVSARLDDGGRETTLPVACPVRSWCVPAGLCDPGYVLYDIKNPSSGETSLQDYICGATKSTSNYVCCDTQELLPNEFRPTPFHWHYERKGEEISGGLVVAPWRTSSSDKPDDWHDDDHVHDDRAAHDDRDEYDGEDHDHNRHDEQDGDFGFSYDTDELAYEDDRIREETELIEKLARLREKENRRREKETSQGYPEGREGKVIRGGSKVNHINMASHSSQAKHENKAKDGSRMGHETMTKHQSKGRKESSEDHEDHEYQTRRGNEKESFEPDEPLVLPQICPLRSMCVPWNLCDFEDVAYDAETSQEKEHLCGMTDDSELFVCCGRLSSTSERLAPTPALSPPLPPPLDHLAEIFMFSPPPITTPPPASLEALRAAKDHSHYLSDVLLKERQRRALPETPPQGQVIYPSQIAAERLKEVRRSAAEPSAESSSFRTTLGGRLKPAGSGGRVKLGGLTAPPHQPSSEPDVRRELPIPPPPPPAPLPLPLPPPPPPPQAPVPSSPPLTSEQDVAEFSVAPVTRDEGPPLPETLSVTPRTVPLADNPDIRPLKAQMWRGDGPKSRSSARGSDEEARPASFLSRILDSLPDALPDGPASRRGHQQGSSRGQFFGVPPPLPVHRPTLSAPHQPPPRGPRPPFHQPVPPHLQPPQQDLHFRPTQQDPHFQPGQHDPTRFRPSSQDTSHFRPPHQDSSHIRPPHQSPSHQRPAHEPPHSQPPHQSPTHQSLHPSLHPTVAPHCGRGAETGLHARITTQRGEDGVTGYGEYPWHVAVLSVDLTYLCAGVLVAPRVALTVAHCVVPLPRGTPLVVRVGDWDLASENELYPAYDVEVVRSVVHPDYYAGNLQNDIALLLLDPPVEGLPHVRPACLPPPHAEFAHQHCWVTGWGQARHVAGDLHDPTSYSWVLREAPVAVVPPPSCQHHLRTTHLGPFYQLPHRGMLCATGRGGSDACFGDGGGALVCPLKEDGPGGPLYAAGLVSWGIGCGQDIPAVYTKVSDYYSWIVAHLEDVNSGSQFQYALGGHARDAGESR